MIQTKYIDNAVADDRNNRLDPAYPHQWCYSSILLTCHGKVGP